MPSAHSLTGSPSGDRGNRAGRCGGGSPVAECREIGRGGKVRATGGTGTRGTRSRPTSRTERTDAARDKGGGSPATAEGGKVREIGRGGGCRWLIRLRQTVPDGAAHAPRARKRAKQDKGRGGRKLYNHYESPDREGIIIYPHSTDGNRETLRLYNPNKQLSLTPLRG